MEMDLQVGPDLFTSICKLLVGEHNELIFLQRQRMVAGMREFPWNEV